MNGLASRFNLARQRSFKGDFFLTSRFGHLNGHEFFESWTKNFG